MEAVVTLVIAALTGLGVMNNRLNNRIHELDRRIDSVEVKVAEDYVSKDDLSGMLDRVEGHMVRIENKLDKLMFK
jgi:uncharacterized coiled-coil protein SlyX